MDYYQVLGLDEKATAEQIKRAYRVLARKYHPDVSKEPDAEEKFKEIGEAYKVLKDKEKRAEYDEIRKYGASNQGFKPPPGWEQRASNNQGGWRYSASDDVPPADFFDEIFGRHSSQGAGYSFNMHGEDVHYRLKISLAEAVNGSRREISFQASGVDDQGKPTTSTTTLNVSIPKGVISGQQLRLRGKGNPGYGNGLAGDLYLELELEPHELFTIEGRDLTIMLPVTPWEVALSEVIEVPTLTGAVTVKIPENAKQGQKIRLKGKGIPGNPPGNLFVLLQIVLPEKLSTEEKALFAEMKRKISFNPRENLKV